MDCINVSLMQRAEATGAAEVLSRAMLDNPLHLAVFLGNGEEQRRQIEIMFAGLMAEAPEVVFLARQAGEIVGVMRMKSCSGRSVPPIPGPDESDTRWRKAVWHAEWARRDPTWPHWHLGPIGVLPSHQGRGIGTMLLERFCAEVDGCRARAYLETDLDRNVRFYEHFGFTVTAESDILGVRNRYMTRPAKT